MAVEIDPEATILRKFLVDLHLQRKNLRIDQASLLLERKVDLH